MGEPTLNPTSNLVKESEKLKPGKNNEAVIKKIDSLLDIYISNEMMFAQFVAEGAVYKDTDGEEVVSDKAIALHKARKDSISDLVKVKLNLQGIVTEGVGVNVIVNNQSQMDELVCIIRKLEDLNKRLGLNGDDNVIDEVNRPGSLPGSTPGFLPGPPNRLQGLSGE